MTGRKSHDPTNRRTPTLKQESAKRMRAEEALETSRRETGLFYSIALSTATTDSFEESLQECLDLICQYIGWPVGHVYAPNIEMNSVLEPTSLWHLDDPKAFQTFREVTDRTLFAPGIGLPGRVLSSGEPTWIVNVQEDDNFPRNKEARDIGVKGGFAFPIKVGAQTVAVLEFFDNNPAEIDQRLLETLTTVGMLFGRLFERKQAQADYQEIVENSAGGIFRSGIDGRILMVNPALAASYGYDSPEDMIEAVGSNIRQLYCYPSQRDEFMSRLSREGSVKEYQIDMYRKDGSIATFSITARQIVDVEGNTKYILGNSLDVSERKRLEEALQTYSDDLERANEELRTLDELKDGFLSNVSHELRTPLGSIKGFAEILLNYDDVDEETQREFLTIINSESERLTRLINDVLDLARIESGRQPWEITELDISDVVTTATRVTNSLAMQQGLTVSIDLDADLPKIRSDKDRLVQVVTNLLSNAIKFTMEGGNVRVTANAQHTEPGEVDGAILVAVSDTGIGIPPEDHGNVFEKFKQAGNTLSDKPKGTGLGLPICKEIVEHFGGRIWLESEPGKGSTFFFTLPVSYSEEDLAT